MLYRSLLPIWLALASLSPSIVFATREVSIRASDYSRITYIPTAAWIHASSTSLCGADYMFSNRSVASLTFKFTGIALYVGLIRFASGAQALIEIDGLQVATVTTYLSATDCTTPAFVKTGLADTEHTVRISDATRNSTYRWLRFNYFTYLEYTPEERASNASMSIASASIASVASVSIASASRASTSATSPAGATTKVNTAVIAGAAVGGVAGLALIVVVTWLLLRKNRQQTQAQGPDHSQQGDYQATQFQVTPQPQPQMGMVDPNSSSVNFAAYPAGMSPYGQPTPMTPTSLTSSPPHSPAPPSFQTERPLSYNSADAQNMANMVAEMVTNRMSTQYGSGQGSVPAPIPEPMDIISTGRQVSPTYAKPPIQFPPV